jgi:Holliday junction resolvase
MSAKAQAGRTARARGRQRERAVAALMREEGWGVGSRRYEKGPGDILASRAIDEPLVDDFGDEGGLAEVRLVEVKSTLTPYAHFSPAERAEMVAYAERIGATAWLAHWPKGGKLAMIPSSKWPS